MEEYNLTIILCCHVIPPEEKIALYQKKCRQLILFCADSAESISSDILVVPWQPEDGKVAALKKAIEQATSTHILWLEANENLPPIPELQAKTFYPASILNVKSESRALNWQIRLFPNFNFDHLSGFEIPELFPVLNKAGICRADESLAIEKGGALFPLKRIKKEVNNEAGGTMYDFWRGILASEEEKFTLAAKYFKKVLKRHELTQWNTLAALNSLANALMESHAPEKAKKIAEESIARTPYQRAPYLILHQYYNLKGDYEKAYQELLRYRKFVVKKTEANWDVLLPKAQTTLLLAEISRHQGRHKQAYKHYSQLFDNSNGNVNQSIIEKLFIYSVELQSRAKAMQYFYALFGDECNNQPDDDRSINITEALSLIVDKGWYDFASDIYSRLVQQQPEDEKLRHGLIRTLIKNDEVEKARALI